MIYKDLMEPYLEKNIVDRETTISEAIILMKQASLPLLIVKGEADRYGVLTKDNLMDAYLGGVSADAPLSHLVMDKAKIRCREEEIDGDIFVETRHLIATDKEGHISGIIAPDAIPQATMKNAIERMKSEIATKNILNQEEDITDWKDTYFWNCEYVNFMERLTKLMHVNKQLWDVIEHSSDSIYVTDQDGISVYANESFEEMTGATVESVLGKSVFDLEAQGIYRPSVSAIVLREKRQITLIQRGINGKDLVVTGTPVFDANKNIYMVICNSKAIEDLSLLKNYLSQMKPSIIKKVEQSKDNAVAVFKSEYMTELMKSANKVSQVDSTVLLTGESGTGKGLIARYIHQNSMRGDMPMVEINCSAIPEQLFESEMFGYEPGAFTGAQKEGKPGIFEMANGGTLFLDEIGDMPMHMQTKLLKVLQDRKFIRIGSVEPIETDVRIIAATNQDLRQLVEKDEFRPDLFYRLNVFPIHIAPLRERPEDILKLAPHFLKIYNEKHCKSVSLAPEVLEKLSEFSWHGNVRELEHFIERLVIVYDGEVKVEDLDFAGEVQESRKGIAVHELMPLKKAVEETERQLINMATCISENSYTVADLLDISQASAHRKITKYKGNNSK